MNSDSEKEKVRGKEKSSASRLENKWGTSLLLGAASPSWVHVSRKLHEK